MDLIRHFPNSEEAKKYEGGSEIVQTCIKFIKEKEKQQRNYSYDYSNCASLFKLHTSINYALRVGTLIILNNVQEKN